MNMKDRMKSVLQDEEVLEELREGGFLDDTSAETESLATAQTAFDVSDLKAATDRLRQGDFAPESLGQAEAIIVRFGHPSLLVQGGTYKKPKLKTWQKRLDPHRSAIDRAIAGVGRIELRGHASHKWVGTGWMIDDRIVVTNRHVARFFAETARGRVAITPGVTPFIDYREEHGSTQAFETEVAEIIHIEDRNSGVDLAFLRLRGDPVAASGVKVLKVAEGLDEASTIGVIGYPAFDPRNSPDDQHRIFEDIYDKKRFAPGYVMDRDGTDLIFQHNCTTLGGNSGSCVIDIATGNVVGLHFGGREGEENRAVRPEIIRDRAASAGISARGSSPGGETETAEAPRHPVSHYAGRGGYDSAFLGDGKLAVPMPKLNVLQQRDAASLSDGTVELKYQHFSVVMNGARRLAFFTAVNIDGGDLWHKRRGRDRWGTDPRIPEGAQVDNALYRRNDFDRGHLVRRLDPVWGSKEKAKLAEEDTFHYTNAAPQHKDLNQRIWLDLENHVLDRSGDAAARISVFTGPVFGTSDPRSKRSGVEEVGIPPGYWKVIASIGHRRRRRILEAQAFVIWQFDMFDASDLELVFGQTFETYQLPVAALGRLTGLDFGALRDADTQGESPEDHESFVEGPASAFRRHAHPVRGPDDIH